MPSLLKITDLAPAPAPGFDQPFEMLQACHGKIRSMLDLVARLCDHIARHGNDAQARTAAQDVMRYFDVAGPQHHLDEERHVVPRLEASGDEKLVQLAQRLRREHRQMELQWAAARPILSAIAQGQLASLRNEQQQTLASFSALYADHIAAEEGQAFPAAMARLGAGDLSAMSQDMMSRRGVR
jgi:hemerythrin-like domain-containing protein